jgi:hypothetical protein
MYYIILNQGIVVRESDQKIVAPCQSVEDPDFVEYQDWVMVQGGIPTVYDTAPPDSPYYVDPGNGGNP